MSRPEKPAKIPEQKLADYIRAKTRLNKQRDHSSHVKFSFVNTIGKNTTRNTQPSMNSIPEEQALSDAKQTETENNNQTPG